MTALLTYVKDSETDQTYMAVVADDTGARYVWAPGVSPWWPDDDERLARITDGKPQQPESAADWMDVATYSLGSTYTTPTVKVSSTRAGVVEAKKTLRDPELQGTENDMASQARFLGEVGRAFDEVTEDYPEFGELDDETEAQAMNNFVLAMLGPIDPEGPNGWILREMDGNPRPGDEKMYLTFGSTAREEE